MEIKRNGFASIALRVDSKRKINSVFFFPSWYTACAYAKLVATLLGVPYNWSLHCCTDCEEHKPANWSRCCLRERHLLDSTLQVFLFFPFIVFSFWFWFQPDFRLCFRLILFCRFGCDIFLVIIVCIGLPFI